MIHKYLAYLKTIETGSITQAAAELGYTQSAVSRMIADLEEHWDVPLLTRNRSGIEISSEGTQLLPILQSIVKGQEELSFAVGELHGLQNGLIRVGAFTSMATGWMPLMIKSFHEKYPNIRFQIFNGEYNQIATWLRRRARGDGNIAVVRFVERLFDDAVAVGVQDQIVHHADAQPALDHREDGEVAADLKLDARGLPEMFEKEVDLVVLFLHEADEILVRQPADGEAFRVAQRVVRRQDDRQ